MKILKRAGALGMAKMIYDQARKPENQARIKAAMGKAKTRGASAKRPR